MARVICILILAWTPGYGEEWSRFRGPNGSGVSSSTDLPESLSPKHHLIWRTPTPTGQSSPIVVDSRICLTGADSTERSVLCYSESDGVQLWKRSIQASREDSRHSLNGPASPTPVTDGRNIYAFFPEYGIVSYDEEGAVRWLIQLRPFSVMHGMASSLVLGGSNVVLVADQSEGFFIAAYDQATGARKWQVARIDGPSGGYATPVVRIDENGDEEIVVSGVLTPTGYAARDGTEVWSLGGMNAQPKSSPIALGTRLYVPSVTSDVAPIFRGAFESFAKLDVNKDGKLTQDELQGRAATILNSIDKFWDGDDGVVALDAWPEIARKNEEGSGLYAVELDRLKQTTEPRVVWKVTRSLPVVPTPILYERVLYVVRDATAGSSPRSTHRMDMY